MSNKTTRFIVEIVSSKEVTSDDMKNIMAENIATAIVFEAREFGLHAEENNAEIVYVKEWYSDKQIIEHI